jgi:hypothetical protein
MEHALHNMTLDFRGGLQNYFIALQSHYGDPRIYALQEAERNADEALLRHHEAVGQANANAAARENQLNEMIEQHRLRMETLLRNDPPRGQPPPHTPEPEPPAP